MILDLPVQQPLILNIIKLEQNPWTEKTNTTKNEYVTVANDTLTKIAEAHQTTVQRLWEANTQLADPDLLEINQTLTIPLNDEVLPTREMPINPTPSPQKVPLTRGFSVSGRFEWGWCTFFADQQRPDIHATGNARDWMRYSNSSVPIAGAVAVSTRGRLGHVGIVLESNNGKVLVRSMNYRGFGVVSDDWTDASYWAGYIL